MGPIEATQMEKANMSAAIAKTMVAAVLAFTISAPSQATWKPEYAAAPQEVQDWYRHAQLTNAARSRFGFQNCCDGPDVVQTKFNVNRVDGRDEWYWLNGDKWQRIPDDIIHWGESAPGGKPTLFVLPDGRPTCFYPGEGGI